MRCRQVPMFAVTTGLFLAGCGTVHPTVSELRSIPGATAAYPGSVAVVGRGATHGNHTLFASNPSMLFTTYCTDADKPALIRWFADELNHADWQSDTNPAGTTSNDVTETQRWTRGHRRFTLQIFSPTYVARLSSQHGQPCPTGYRTTVQ